MLCNINSNKNIFIIVIKCKINKLHLQCSHSNLGWYDYFYMITYNLVEIPKVT